MSASISGSGRKAYTIVDGGDWSATVRQVLPTATRVLGRLRPTFSVQSVCAIDAAFLADAGIRALIWDVDGTLTYRHACRFAPEAAAHFERLQSIDWLRHAILSNCGEARFQQLAELCPNLPVVKAYRAESGMVARVRRGDQDEWSDEPRGELRPLRKPDPNLIDFALRALDLDDRSRVAIVGDQHLTDIAAANLAGILSIKVPTLGRPSFPRAVRALQSIDALLFRLSEAGRRWSPG